MVAESGLQSVVNAGHLWTFSLVLELVRRLLFLPSVWFDPKPQSIVCHYVLAKK